MSPLRTEAATFQPPPERPALGADGAAPPPTTADHPAQTIVTAVIVILVIEAPIVVAMLLSVGGTARSTLTVLALGLLTLPLIIGTMLRLLWSPHARRFPARPIGPDTVARSFQSFSLGRLGGFNNCLRIIVDEDHLHLQMPLVLRCFGLLPEGRSRISIPWSAITNVRRGLLPGTRRATLAGRHAIAGPAWCLSLAEPPPRQLGA